jgi:hypothetical protein
MIFQKSSGLSCHFWWRDKTILSSFSMSKTPSNVANLATPHALARLRYLVAPKGYICKICFFVLLLKLANMPVRCNRKKKIVIKRQTPISISLHNVCMYT